MDPVHLDYKDRIPLVPFGHHLLVCRPARIPTRMTVVDVVRSHGPAASEAVRLQALLLSAQGEPFLRLVLRRYSSINRHADHACPSRGPKERYSRKGCRSDESLTLACAATHWTDRKRSHGQTLIISMDLDICGSAVNESCYVVTRKMALYVRRIRLYVV